MRLRELLVENGKEGAPTAWQRLQHERRLKELLTTLDQKAVIKFLLSQLAGAKPRHFEPYPTEAYKEILEVIDMLRQSGRDWPELAVIERSIDQDKQKAYPDGYDTDLDDRVFEQSQYDEDDLLYLKDMLRSYFGCKTLDERDVVKALLTKLKQGYEEKQWLYAQYIFDAINLLRDAGYAWPVLEKVEQYATKMQFDAVEDAVGNIGIFKNTSLELQLAAVNKYPESIHWIRNVRPEVKELWKSYHQRSRSFIKPHNDVFEQSSNLEDELRVLRWLNSFLETDCKTLEEKEVVKAMLLKLKEAILTSGWGEGENLERAVMLLRRSGYDWPALDVIEQSIIKMQFDAVKDGVGNISYFKNPSLELQLAAISANPAAINYIEDPHPEAEKLWQKVRREKNAKHITENDLNDLQGTEEELISIVTIDPWQIMKIKNPSEAVQLAAVKSCGPDGNALYNVVDHAAKYAPSRKAILPALLRMLTLIVNADKEYEYVNILALIHHLRKKNNWPELDVIEKSVLSELDKIGW